MNIFPTSSDFFWNEASSSSSKDNGRDSFGFSQLFAKHFKNAPAEITPEFDGIPLDGNDASSRADIFTTEVSYDSMDSSRVDVSTFYSHTPIEEVRFTDTELQKVIDSLNAQGASTEALEALKGSPNGVSISDTIHAVAEEAPVSLTESDMVRIENLALELDSSGQLGEDMLADLRQGYSLQAWSRFAAAMAAQDPSKKLSISRADLVSLGKALGSNPATLDALFKSFNGNKELSLTTDELKGLLVPLQQQMTNKIDAQNKLASQLEAALLPVIKEARKRIEDEATAGSRELKRAQQSELLIQDTVTKGGLGKIQQKDIVDEAGKSLQNKEANGGSRLDNTGIQGQSVESAKFSGQFNDKDTSKESDLFDKHKGQNSKDTRAYARAQDTSNSNPWESFAQRLGLSQSMGTVIPTQQSAHNAQTTSWNRLASTVFSQVEQGTFSSLRNGTSRLELTINPLDLGTVNILLTTKNGEVSALLRPERAETTAALIQQMESLRAELEQQGLKVDKVEVQTQLKDEQGMHWQSLDQHNASQEQFARSKDLERLRMLGKIRHESHEEEISLAHNLQDRGITAGNSSHVYIIA